MRSVEKHALLEYSTYLGECSNHFQQYNERLLWKSSTSRAIREGGNWIDSHWKMCTSSMPLNLCASVLMTYTRTIRSAARAPSIWSIAELMHYAKHFWLLGIIFMIFTLITESFKFSQWATLFLSASHHRPAFTLLLFASIYSDFLVSHIVRHALIFWHLIDFFIMIMACVWVRHMPDSDKNAPN